MKIGKKSPFQPSHPDDAGVNFFVRAVMNERFFGFSDESQCIGFQRLINCLLYI
jgi:hypothetical protein